MSYVYLGAVSASDSAAVRDSQQFLKTQGFNVTVDGVAGPQTANAQIAYAQKVLTGLRQLGGTLASFANGPGASYVQQGDLVTFQSELAAACNQAAAEGLNLAQTGYMRAHDFCTYQIVVGQASSGGGGGGGGGAVSTSSGGGSDIIPADIGGGGGNGLLYAGLAALLGVGGFILWRRRKKKAAGGSA